MRGGEKRGRVHQYVNTRHISPMGYLLLNISKGTLAFAAGYLWNILSRDKEEREVWIALERVDSFHTLFSRRLCSLLVLYIRTGSTHLISSRVSAHTTADTHGPRLRACLSQSQSAFNPASTWGAIAARNDSQIWSSFQKPQHIKLKIFFLFLKMLGGNKKDFKAPDLHSPQRKKGKLV